MSRLITGYVNGRPDWTDQGPSRARVAGYGGSLVTHTLTVPRPRRHPEHSANISLAVLRSMARCGLPMRCGALCGRRAGHGRWCSTPEAVARDTARRRAL